MPSLSDQMIIDLLDGQQEPMNAAVISLSLGDYPFSEIVERLGALQQAGVVAADSFGFKLVGSAQSVDSEAPAEHDVEDAAVPNRDECPSPDNLPPLSPEEATAAPDGREGRLATTGDTESDTSCDPPVFSNVLRLDPNLKDLLDTLATKLTPQARRDSGEGDVPTAQDEVSQIAEVDVEAVVQDDPPDEAASVQPEPQEALGAGAGRGEHAAYEDVVAALAGKGMDEGLGSYSDLPFIGAPSDSPHDDAPLLYAKLMGLSLGEGLDEYPDEPIIGAANVDLELDEPESATARETVAETPTQQDRVASVAEGGQQEPLESSSGQPEEKETPDSNVAEATVGYTEADESEVEREYRELLDAFSDQFDEQDPADETAGEGEDTNEPEDVATDPDNANVACWTCWTPVSTMNLPARAENACSRRSIKNAAELVRSLELLESAPGIGILTYNEMCDALTRHSSVAPQYMDASQVLRLCEASGSSAFFFDVFGNLMRTDEWPSMTSVRLSADNRINASSSITSLGLSYLATKALINAGYTTIGDVSRPTEIELPSQRGIRTRVISELQDALDSLASKGQVPDRRVASHSFLALADSQIPISATKLPNRLKNAFSRRGFRTVGEIALLSDEYLLSMRGIGTLMVEQFKETLQGLLKTEAGATVSPGEEEERCHQVTCEQQSVRQGPEDDTPSPEDLAPARQGAATAFEVCQSRTYPVFEPSFLAIMPYVAIAAIGEGRNEEEYCDAIVDALEQSDGLADACASVLADRLETFLSLGDDESFDAMGLPDGTVWDTVAKEVARSDDRYTFSPERHEMVVHRPRLMERVDSSDLDERTSQILRMYLSGKTLEECGRQFGLTRERVRQMAITQLSRMPSVEEDRYRHFYETYGPSKSDFLATTGEPVSTYVYLRSTNRQKGSERPALSKALGDARVPEHVRDSIRALIDKEYVYADGYRIAKKREAIITHVVMRHASSSLITLAKLKELYDQFVRDHDLGDVKGLQFSDMNNFEHNVERYDQILKLPHAAEARYGGSIRYYDATDKDFGPLAKLLSSEALGNIECSASLLMDLDGFPEVLEELDVHNGHELHYVLGRYCPTVDGMKLLRTPMVSFGDGNRNDQLLELIKELSPVSATDLAEAYSERYGVEATTVAGSYLGDFKIYLRHGKYVYNTQGLDRDQAAFVEGQLSDEAKDFHSISLIKARFKSRFPEASTSLVNAENVARFGFHPSGGLLIRDGVDERALFGSLLDSRKRVSIDDPELGKDVFDNLAFQAELNIRIRAYRLVEYEKGSYLSSSMITEQYDDLGEADLRDYVESAIAFMEPDEPYTVKSLVEGGFRHRIDALRDDFGLDDFFFASLLGNGTVGGRLKKTSIGDTAVFCRTPYSYSSPILVEQIMRHEEAMDIDDLAYLMSDKYGIQASDSLLRSVVKRSSLYFSETLDMVFDSEETYRRKAHEWIS